MDPLTNPSPRYCSLRLNRLGENSVSGRRTRGPGGTEALRLGTGAGVNAEPPRDALGGGADGIGSAIVGNFARQGSKVAFVDINAAYARATIERCIADGVAHTPIFYEVDLRDIGALQVACTRAIDDLGGVTVLVNNAAFQEHAESIEDITEEQFRRTFETNIFGYFHMAQAALPHLREGSSIINTGSIVGIVGNKILIDYTASKGAIHAFTKSLALSLGERGIRVNCVVPGPVWTPNIPGTMPMSEIEKFGHEVALKRPGQPDELAPAYVLLASDDGSFMTGSLVEVTGGKLG